MNNWVVEAIRYGSGMVVDKRVYIELSKDESKKLHRSLFSDTYWHQVRSFDENKQPEIA